MFSEILILITAIIFFFIGFYSGRNTLPEKVEEVKFALQEKFKRKGPVVVDTDEYEVEKREMREDKEIIDLKDFPK